MSWTEDWLWPKVDLRRKAQKAIEEGFWAASFVAVFAAVLALIGFLRDSRFFDVVQLSLAVLFGALAFGIRRRSRTAAICALSLYIFQRILFWGPIGPFQAISLLFVLAFANCIRGTFAYQRFSPLPANIPSVEQSFRAMANTAPSSESRNDAAKS
ncbi:MAG TPA: hypothetical protein VN025_18520 [Candidatus Dormibacteraeota bacterium]|jgi:hypothetical protein|nr:hypothetical protein [Candidatus Dormibacteraeota bacterium]